MKKKSSQTISTKNNSPQIPKSILKTGKVLQFISPTLATHFALKLFKTPIRFKTPNDEKIVAEKAKKETVFIPEINKEIMVYSNGNSTKKALLVHGWSGRGTQLFDITNNLLENGFMTVSFDAPAHGKSSGKTTMMTDFIASIKYLDEKMGPFEIAIGHSLGGMAVLNSVSQGAKFKKVISISAADYITDIIEDFVTKLELKPILVPKIKKHFLKKFNKDIDDYSASYAAKNIKIPTLIIHDATDREAPVSCAKNIRQNLEQGELLITNGLGHTRILKDSQVIDRIIKFIN